MILASLHRTGNRFVWPIESKGTERVVGLSTWISETQETEVNFPEGPLLLGSDIKDGAYYFKGIFAWFTEYSGKADLKC